MSRQNKVTPGQYTSAGRLSPDDLGRELRRQNGKAAAARGPKPERPPWETSQPALRSASQARPAARPGRVKIAAARTVIGVTRVTARAAKTVTGAARKIVAKGAGRAPGTAQPAAKAAAKAPARRAAKRR